MDELDTIVLKSYEKIIVEIIKAHNVIHVFYAISQSYTIFTEAPLNRVSQWMSLTDFRCGNNNTVIWIDKIPKNIDGTEIGMWLAKEYKKTNKKVEIRNWVEPGKMETIEL